MVLRRCVSEVFFSLFVAGLAVGFVCGERTVRVDAGLPIRYSQRPSIRGRDNDAVYQCRTE